MTPWPDAPIVPAYGPSTLTALLPGVARALGADTCLPAADVPASRSICVVVLDGLGLCLLREAAATAPFLHSLIAGSAPFTAGCPSTTATSLASLGTGLPPGRHGLVGYEVLDPDRRVLLNQLTWDPAVDPLHWQPHRTVLETLAGQGVSVTTTGNPEFAGSGLSTAALRGGEFIGLKRLNRRVDLALDRLAAPGRGLVYLYWGALDGAGHQYGIRSHEWLRELRRVDHALARLARRLPPGAALVITADHGMVDVPHGDRLDLGTRDDLAAGVEILGGEPRLAQLYCAPGSSAAVAARFSDALGHRAWVRTRDAAVAEGWFGPLVEDRVLPRIGDVLVAARGSFALVDSRTARPHLLRLIGQHGSLTAAELEVPLLVQVG